MGRIRLEGYQLTQRAKRPNLLEPVGPITAIDSESIAEVVLGAGDWIVRRKFPQRIEVEPL